MAIKCGIGISRFGDCDLTCISRNQKENQKRTQRRRDAKNAQSFQRPSNNKFDLLKVFSFAFLCETLAASRLFVRFFVTIVTESTKQEWKDGKEAVSK
jgi:hypothetical protein